MQKPSKATLCVQGMHCASCDILVKSQFEDVKGITKVTADHTNQMVEVEYEGELDREALQQSISEFGYKLVDTTNAQAEPLAKRIVEGIVLTLILGMLYLMTGELNLIPEIDPTGNLSLGTVFLIGIVASLSTCMATTGALYLATIGKMTAPGGDSPATLKEKSTSTPSRLMPAIGFNIGRIATYAALGFINGMVGKVVTQDLKMGSSLNLIVAIFMVLLGLDMLKIISLSKLLPDSFLKNMFVKIEKHLARNPRRTAFLLGALTYWLPCGFTQSVQLYALAVADPIRSAAIMFVFALGTLPALLAIGFASSFMKSNVFSWFMKTAGAFALLIGIISLINFLNLYNLNPLSSLMGQSVPVKGAAAANADSAFQILNMAVSNRGYSPATFTVTKGKPVKWIIDGQQVYGCQGLLVAPKIGVNQPLKEGQNIITFTPKEVGEIGFSCSMGMYPGKIEVVEG